MKTNSSLVLLFMAATMLDPLHNRASAIDPPAGFLPEPGWVNLVEQRGGDERLAGYLVPQGVKLELVAEHPLLGRAGDCCFGPDGALMVLEWRPEALTSAKETRQTVTYRDGSKRSFLRSTTPVKDAIKVIPEPGAPGAFDTAKVILESELVSSMLPYGDWLYTAGSGTVSRHQRNKADGRYGSPAIVAQGFGGLGARASFGLAFDFDGSLIIAVGPGSHDVEGSDGSRALVEGSGAVFRCRPDGSQMELLAQGLGEPRGAAVFDRGYQAFQLDVSPSSTSTSRRLLHLTEKSDFGFRANSGSHPPTEDSFRKQVLRELPGVMPPMNSRARDASGGLCIYADSSFPPFFQGLLLCPDPARRSILALKPERRDSTFAITEQFDLIKSEDPRFFPVRVFVGPDGAIYVTDRSGQLNTPAAAKRDGRLFRLSWSGGPAHPALPLHNPSIWSRIPGLGGTDLVKRLGAIEGAQARVAQQELIRRGPLNKAALIVSLGNRELPVEARILAAGVLCSWWDDEIKNAMIKLATDDEAALRKTAAEALGRYSARRDPQVQEVLLYILGDPDPSSRRSVALAMARVAAPEAADCLATTLSFDIGGDPCLRDGLVRALAQLGKPGLERLLVLANSGEDDRLELAVESFSALHAPQALEFLPQLLNHPHLRSDQRVRLIRSLVRYENVPTGAFQPVIRHFVGRLPREPDLWLALAEVCAIRFLKNPGGFVTLFFGLIPK